MPPKTIPKKRDSSHLSPLTAGQQTLDKHYKLDTDSPTPVTAMTTPENINMEALKQMFAESNRELSQSLCAKIDQTNDKIDQTNEKIDTQFENLDTKLTAFDTRLSQAELSTANNTEEIKKLWTELSELKKNASAPAQVADMDRMEKCARNLDAIERRNNLIITGLAEEQGETKSQLLQKVKSVLNDISVIDALPSLVSRKGRKRVVLMQFETRLKRDKVWNARLSLRKSRVYGNVYIDADLTPEVQLQRYLERQERRAQNGTPAHDMEEL